MTEKRFVPIGVEWTDGFIQDHEGDKDLFSVNAVCDLLNEVSYENKQLKKENEELKREIKKFKKLWADTFMENAELREKIDKSNKRFVKKLNTISKQWG